MTTNDTNYAATAMTDNELDTVVGGLTAWEADRPRPPRPRPKPQPSLVGKFRRPLILANNALRLAPDAGL